MVFLVLKNAWMIFLLFLKIRLSYTKLYNIVQISRFLTDKVAVDFDESVFSVPKLVCIDFVI